MNMPLFDRNKLIINPLRERKSDLDMSIIKSLDYCSKEVNRINEDFDKIADRIIKAKDKGASIIFMMGAHVLRSGVQKCLIDLMKRGYISCLATNGAGIIHDYEFAITGETTESVAKYIQTGEFGLWTETGRLNDIINAAYGEDKNTGMGEAVGRKIEESGLPHKDISIFAAAWRLGIQATVHVSIGYDIIHELPNCDGAATGALSYNDFLKFTSVVQNLENGVIMNFGSAVMAPEVFLKALSMARNIAYQEKKEINHFTALVCDLHKLPGDYHRETDKRNPDYYFRPWKTMLVRTVTDGGESFYIQGGHSETIPALWRAVNRQEEENGKNT